MVYKRLKNSDTDIVTYSSYYLLSPKVGTSHLVCGGSQSLRNPGSEIRVSGTVAGGWRSL
ncbi:MAG TPA: hypothetical protein V6D50_15150 [Chroococcales cyanobacterium]